MIVHAARSARRYSAEFGSLGRLSNYQKIGELGLTLHLEETYQPAVLLPDLPQLHHQAVVLHDIDPRARQPLRRFVISDPELKPH